MNEKLVFRVPKDEFDFDDVDLLAGTLTQLFGEPVTATEYFEVITGSERAARTLQAALGVKPRRAKAEIDEEAPLVLAGDAIAAQWERADGALINAASLEKGNGNPLAAADGRKPGPKGEYRSWRIYLPGRDEIAEQITKSEKEERLAKGLFVPMSLLHHPSGGKYLVHGEKHQHQTLELVNGGGHQGGGE